MMHVIAPQYYVECCELCHLLAKEESLDNGNEIDLVCYDLLCGFVRQKLLLAENFYCISFFDEELLCFVASGFSLCLLNSEVQDLIPF